MVGACGGRDATCGGCPAAGSPAAGRPAAGRPAGWPGAGVAPAGVAGRLVVSAGAGRGCAAVWVAGLFPLIRSIASLTLSHPVVATANSAKSASVLRRMTCLHGLEDAGAVGAAQQWV